ncbi:hypothetical protein NDU88_001676 [Pleurodeles waltl]|uniref:Uncharacterized protein n=1 Tax=Pleurodeles waltl TaxID=8319 RepID=A0AAV7T0N2_PLEWA|nr:hypothetical protein NDU88_001676 [Pleurodeles waltl]
MPLQAPGSAPSAPHVPDSTQDLSVCQARGTRPAHRAGRGRCPSPTSIALTSGPSLPHHTLSAYQPDSRSRPQPSTMPQAQPMCPQPSTADEGPLRTPGHPEMPAINESAR